MTRELLILRHAKSDWKTDTDDFHRPLKPRGKRGARQIGIWLAQQGIIPDIVISSPAQRARDTTERACKAMGFPKKAICYEKRLYLADLTTLLTLLKNVPPSAQRVLLVGHNPGLEALLQYLVHESLDMPGDGKLLPTATVARLDMPKDWHELAVAQARLLSITRAKTLPGETA